MFFVLLFTIITNLNDYHEEFFYILKDICSNQKTSEIFDTKLPCDLVL